MAMVRAADVLAARTWATWALRAAGVALMSWGASLALKRLIFGAAQGQPFFSWDSWMETGESESLSRGAALLVVGGVLASASRWIAHWMVTVPPRGCPGCGYAGPGRDGVCPECGMRLETPARS